MALQELVVPSLETIVSYYKSNKLILIHPSSRFRTLLIAALINSPPAPLYYYGFGAEDGSLEQFIAGLVRDLADQKPTFGRHVNPVRANSPDDIEALAQALASDLAELEQEHFLLVLDEFDRADEVDEVQTFFEYLLHFLPEQAHVLVNSRTLPRLPWVALVAKSEAVVLRDAELLNTGFYAIDYTETPNVEVYALGSGYVIVNGQHVSTWEGHLPRLLFFFALDRPMVTRAEICQSFWPELPIDQAVNVFHVTKRRLHKALDFDVLEHESGHYRVNSALNLHYDILEFVSSLVEARNAEPADAALHWQHAIDIYRGDYLQGHTDPWLTSRREDFRAGYLEALTNLAAIRDAEGASEVALGLYLRAVSVAANREDLHREVIRLYGNLGRRSEAVEHYQQLEQDLRDRYGIEPSPETQAIFQEASGR